MESNFGMAHLKAEGAPLHPDDIENFPDDITEEQYNMWYSRQLTAYEEYWSNNAI